MRFFAAAISVWEACRKSAETEPRINLSECYNGGDEFMRVVMRTANRFEKWASLHIAFSELDDVWPYMMEDKFGAACVSVMGAESLTHFDDNDCLRVALHLRLPVKVSDGLPVPVDVIAENPLSGSAFRTFRILTVREFGGNDGCEPFTLDDDPFDEQFSPPFFGIYGVGDDGLREHIADRDTYAEAVSLVRNLIPGIAFPDTPPFLPTSARE